MKTKLPVLMMVVGLAALGARADDPKYNDSKGMDKDRDSAMEKPMSANDVGHMLDRLSISLPDLIQTAERRSGGKACSVEVMEWRCVRPCVMKDTQNSDVTPQHLTDMNPESPVACVVCVNKDKNQVNELVVCGKTGKVLDMRQTPNFVRGESVYFSTRGGRRGGEMSGTADIWFRAPERWQKLSDLMKKPLRATSSNEHIGEVKDIAIDPDAGRIMYFVVEFYGKMGHGNRWYAVPLGVARLSPDYGSVTMDYSSSQITDANGFDRNNWPNIVDPTWSKNVYQAFGATPYWSTDVDRNGRKTETNIHAGNTDVNVQTGHHEGHRGRREIAAPTRWQKASDLLGKTVRNPQDKDLGHIKDITCDPDSGRILYGVLSFGGFLGIGDKYFAIPWETLQLTPDYKYVTLDIDKDRLKNAEGFDKDHWPNMADERWATNIYKTYNRRPYWEEDSDMPPPNNNPSDPQH